MTSSRKAELLQGTLDLLILKSIEHQALHGFGISQRIAQVSNEVLEVEQGSLYPALYRLEDKGWISSEWGVSENNRRARYYTLTKAGRRQLEEEERQWDRVSGAINLILRQSARDAR